jgi:hypothetical protein
MIPPALAARRFARYAMNTIPTTFNETLPSYTVVGGRERRGSTGLSVVLLNRGGHIHRKTLFQELEKKGFDFVVSIEGDREHYDVEELSDAFPFVRFILFSGGISPGEQINLAASELSSPLFFVLWNDIKILSKGPSLLMAERLYRSQEEWKKSGSGGNPLKRLCTVPLIQNPRFETLPTLISPAVFRNTVKTIFSIPQREGHLSLYPFDGIGIYDRDRFMRLGGFDGLLKNFHWQLMDFGFRSYLWGEEIASTQLVKLAYNGETPPEDKTPEESYRRFYLKNLAPVFREDHAHLPLRRFPAYLFRSGEDPLSAWENFAAGRRWVTMNRSRFVCDARIITARWDEPGFRGEL